MSFACDSDWLAVTILLLICYASSLVLICWCVFTFISNMYKSAPRSILISTLCFYALAALTNFASIWEVLARCDLNYRKDPFANHAFTQCYIMQLVCLCSVWFVRILVTFRDSELQLNKLLVAAYIFFVSIAVFVATLGNWLEMDIEVRDALWLACYAFYVVTVYILFHVFGNKLYTLYNNMGASQQLDRRQVIAFMTQIMVLNLISLLFTVIAAICNTMRVYDHGVAGRIVLALVFFLDFGVANVFCVALSFNFSHQMYSCVCGGCHHLCLSVGYRMVGTSSDIRMDAIQLRQTSVPPTSARAATPPSPQSNPSFPDM